MGHMDLCVAQLPDDQKLSVAVSFLRGHAFDRFKVVNQIDQVESWSDLKNKLKERFQPVSKVKIARNKLESWKQVQSVELYNESLLKIIIDIPNIPTVLIMDGHPDGHS